MDNEVTSILFVPVCRHCLNIIWDEVNAEPRIFGEEYDISPNQCPSCGAWFDGIAIPSVPFNTRVYLSQGGYING